MYKFLLAWRYLRTRYIALASIVSVTLGVATLIVVNSVMEGFASEMHRRLHDILSDVVVESHDLIGMPSAEWHMEEIRKIAGDSIDSMTAVVHVPAMMNINVNGRWITRPVTLIGIDENSYPTVSSFSEYLLHPENQKRLSFELREDGYAPTKEHFPKSGWSHRRESIRFQRAMESRASAFSASRSPDPAEPSDLADAPDSPDSQIAAAGPSFTPLPTFLPELPERLDQDPIDEGPPEPVDADSNHPSTIAAGDPYRGGLPHQRAQVFDPLKQQYTGVVLGIAIGSTRHRTADGNVRDFYYCRPGDDVQITFPNASQRPQAVYDHFTVVDMYESKMSEQDSTFAFVPLRRLQEMRGMFDPASGVYSVSAIQIKLKPGSNLNAVRDALRGRFPPEVFAYDIETWRDLQGPLLSAVKLETTLLNILLFLIIAVAGFGILATFFMIVVEKTRDIGILKALGAPSGGVMSIFLSYGVSLGVLGSGAGVIIGLLFVAYINEIAAVIEAVTGREVFDPTVYYFQQIPTIVEASTVAWVIAGAVGIAVLASVLPAIRAARLHPVEALRYE